ncbi:hypothetical protein HZS_3728 [Henneguya salminicola]|nr:hypothetical protein HZS_3728 [Henneguya salminicola]
MIRTSTILFISLILSSINYVNWGQNISYKLQYQYAQILDHIYETPIDKKNTIQSSRPLFYDVAIVVTNNAGSYCGPRLHNITQYIELLFQSASRILSLHRITLSVVKSDLWCQQNNVTPSHKLNTTDYENYFSSISPRPDVLVVFE